MVELTIAVDDAVLSRAKERAREDGTSLVALLTHFLESYATPAPAPQDMSHFLSLAVQARGNSGSGGRTWSRQDLHRH